MAFALVSRENYHKCDKLDIPERSSEHNILECLNVIVSDFGVKISTMFFVYTSPFDWQHALSKEYAFIQFFFFLCVQMFKQIIKCLFL